MSPLPTCRRFQGKRCRPCVSFTKDAFSRSFTTTGENVPQTVWSAAESSVRIPQTRQSTVRYRKGKSKLMNKKVRWGVLGVANIAVKQVIPAMQKGEWSEVRSIASRDVTRARQAAQALGIAKAYGSYEDLLADDEIEAIYNPLP